MPKFSVVESRPATIYWEYVVEAETEEQALDLVLDGDVEAIHTWTEESSNDDLSEFEVFDNKENN